MYVEAGCVKAGVCVEAVCMLRRFISRVTNVGVRSINNLLRGQQPMNKDAARVKGVAYGSAEPNMCDFHFILTHLYTLYTPCLHPVYTFIAVYAPVYICTPYKLPYIHL